MSSSEPSTRLAYVDDRDPRIQYSGSWSPFPASTLFDSHGYTGPPFNSTLMQSASTGASISFSFEGYAVGFYGTVASTLSRFVPRYSCFIDGIEISRSDSSAVHDPTNRSPLCHQAYMEDTRHTATFTIDEVDELDDPILFDFVGYWPSPGADIGDTTEEVLSNDPRVSFSAGNWMRLGDSIYTYFSTHQGASVTLFFEGQSVSLISAIPHGTFTDGRSTYVLDGGPPISFTMPGSISQTQTYWNQMLFNITDLSEEPHTLVVTDNARYIEQQTLIVSGFQIRGHSSNDSEDDSQPDNNHNDDDGGSSGVSSTALPSTGGLSTGAKAGVAVGAVIGVALITALVVFFIYRRRQQRVHKNHIGKSKVLDMPYRELATPGTPSSGTQPLTPGTADRPLPMTTINAHTPYGQPPIAMSMLMAPPNGLPPNGTPSGDARDTMLGNSDHQYLAANAYHQPSRI